LGENLHHRGGVWYVSDMERGDIPNIAAYSVTAVSRRLLCSLLCRM